MSVFRFRLARLLRVRKVEEELARERWKAAERAARTAEGEESVRRDELVCSIESSRAQRARVRIEPSRVLAADAAIEGQREALAAAAGRARGARLSSETARAAWFEAKRAHQGLTRLEARDRDLARRAAGEKETRELDEVASTRAERAASRDAGRAVPGPTRSEA